jgi:hypothetical protein
LLLGVRGRASLRAAAFSSSRRVCAVRPAPSAHSARVWAPPCVRVFVRVRVCVCAAHWTCDGALLRRARSRVMTFMTAGSRRRVQARAATAARGHLQRAEECRTERAGQLRGRGRVVVACREPRGPRRTYARCAGWALWTNDWASQASLRLYHLHGWRTQLHARRPAITTRQWGSPAHPSCADTAVGLRPSTQRSNAAQILALRSPTQRVTA